MHTISFDAILSGLLARGLKRTHALTCLLREMLADARPRTLAEWAACSSLRERSEVTVYRLMLRLEQEGVVRRVNPGGRTTRFCLASDNHSDCLVLCRTCGDLRPLTVPLPNQALVTEVENRSGWQKLRFSLVFIGLCPSCGLEPHLHPHAEAATGHWSDVFAE